MHESLGAFWPAELRLIRITINTFLGLFRITENNRVVEMFQAFAWHLLQLLRPWLCVLQTTHFAEHLVPLAFTGSLVTYTSDVANDSASLCFTGEEIMKMPALPGGLGV